MDRLSKRHLVASIIFSLLLSFHPATAADPVAQTPHPLDPELKRAQQRLVAIKRDIRDYT